MTDPRHRRGRPSRRSIRSSPLVAATAAVVALVGVVTAPAANASAPAAGVVSPVAPSHRPPATPFPPTANSAWAYDVGDGAGDWVQAIEDYNQHATGSHRLNEVYSYATDLEMYCPDNDGTKCTAGDLYSFYTPGGGGYARTDAYYQALAAQHPGSFYISPIIDGRTDAGGYMQGFNELNPALARGFADEVAGQICADPYVDGIQFDIEPFDVTTRNGQYYFYLQVAKDFAGKHAGTTAADPYGCVDATHPRGRFFSVFTFAQSIKPHTRSAANVQDILNAYGNGYFMDSLYDLSDAPAGTLNGIGRYRPAVLQEAAETRWWADLLHIKYGYGIPASASAHEFTTCSASPGAGGSCLPDATGANGYPMIQYTRAAVAAIDLVGAPRDPRFLGTAIWDFGDHVSWNGLNFGPVPPPADVLNYLAKHLPGA